MLKFFGFTIVLIFALSQAQAKSLEETPRFLVHLLDYLAKDYSGAVTNGKVTNPGEYSEQIEFVGSAVQTNRVLDETKGAPELQTKLEGLKQLIENKRSATEVAALAREIQAQIIQVTHLEMAPTRWPSLARGRQLYANNCVTCHGQTGNGDGPAGLSLTPKPSNFLDAYIMREISPFQAFNTIRLGVPGTGMAPYHGLSDKEVWDLAFYVVSLRHAGKPNQSVAPSEWSDDSLNQAATLSDLKLEASFGDATEKEKSEHLVALRTHSDDDIGGSSLTIARTQLDEVVQDYEAGNIESAKTKALKAYLEGIEPIEPRMKASDPEAVSRLESKMAAVRGVIQAKGSVAELRAAVRAAKDSIDSAEEMLKNKVMSPWVAFLAAAAILLREGFEAVLVIIALLGVIRAAQAKKAARWVHGGWISALGLGAVAWFFSGWLLGISGAQRETLEGATSLFAVAVLLIVGFWLHSQTEIGRWKSFIHGKVQKALQGKNLWGLASIAFIAVFREALETVLFLRAIWFEAGDDSRAALMAGVFGSLALVIVMAWAILRFSAKLPIRKLFAGSALMMAALAFILTGKGMHSFQETGLVSVTNPAFVLRFDWLGIFPTWETLMAQMIVFVAVIGLWIYGSKPSLALSVHSRTDAGAKPMT